MELMKFCGRHGIHLISDEIYALSSFENPDAPDAPVFTSILSVENDGHIDPSLVHVMYGMSKVGSAYPPASTYLADGRNHRRTSAQTDSVSVRSSRKTARR